MTGPPLRRRAQRRRVAARQRVVRKGIAASAAFSVLAGVLAGAQALAAPGFQDRAALVSDWGASHFELALLDDSGRIRSVVSDGADTISFTPAADIVPGSTVQIPVTVANNGPFNVAPSLGFSVESNEVDSIAELVRLTVVEQAACVPGEQPARTLIGDPSKPAQGVGLAGIESLSGTQMPARSGGRQQVGASYSGGDAACRNYLVLAHLADDASLRALSSAAWTLDMTLEGRSAE